MDPVLIYTDTQRIALEKATLNKAKTLFQAVLDAINNTLPGGYPPPEVNDNRLKEINNLVSWTVNLNGGPEFVKRFVLDKLDSLLGDYVYNGVVLNAAKRRELIVMPDVTAINVALAQARQTFNSTVKATQLSLLQIINTDVFIVDDANATIEALYTYYTKTDFGAAVATSLGAICADLNTHAGAYPSFLNNWLGTPSAYIAETGIPGIVIDTHDDTFFVDYQYIRKIEAQNAV